MSEVMYIYPPEMEEVCRKFDEEIRYLQEKKREMTGPIDAQIERLYKAKADMIATTMPQIIIKNPPAAPPQSTPQTPRR